MTALIAAHDLSFGRGDALLSGLTFEIHPGQTWFVLGRNGSGKSTLMHTLLLEITPGAGQVTAAPDIADRSRLGVVAQTDPGPCRLPSTVFEFVTLGLAGLALETALARTRTRAALAAMGIEHLAPRGIDALSGGERQRARVARALARQPRLLLLDEPTAALDLPSTAALVERLLALQQREGIALFWISHDLELARRHASHLLALDGSTATVHEVHGARDSGSWRALLAHAAGMVGTHTVMHDCG